MLLMFLIHRISLHYFLGGWICRVLSVGKWVLTSTLTQAYLLWHSILLSLGWNEWLNSQYADCIQTLLLSYFNLQLVCSNVHNWSTEADHKLIGFAGTELHCFCTLWQKLSISYLKVSKQAVLIKHLYARVTMCCKHWWKTILYYYLIEVKAACFSLDINHWNYTPIQIVITSILPKQTLKHLLNSFKVFRTYVCLDRHEVNRKVTI